MNMTEALKQYEDDRQIKHLEITSIREYKRHVREENFLFAESHGYLVDSFTGRCFAASKEQLDELISFLKDIRGDLAEHDSRYK